MTIVNRVLDLPTLEPMTATHLEKVATVIMSCLYASVAAAVASTIMSMGGSHSRPSSASGVASITTMKEEELETMCNSVVLKGVSVAVHQFIVSESYLCLNPMTGVIIHCEAL